MESPALGQVSVAQQHQVAAGDQDGKRGLGQVAWQAVQTEASPLPTLELLEKQCEGYDLEAGLGRQVR